MSEAFDISRRRASGGSFSVVAPCRGDMLSGALQRAFHDRRTMPDDFALLLAQLDRVDSVRQ
jgi:hypothetical protein